MKLTTNKLVIAIAKALDECVDEYIFLSDVMYDYDCGVLIDNDVWLMDADLMEDGDEDEDYDALTVDEMLYVNKEYDREIYYSLRFDDNHIWNEWRDKYDYEQVELTKEMVEEFRRIG